VARVAVGVPVVDIPAVVEAIRVVVPATAAVPHVVETMVALAAIRAGATATVGATATTSHPIRK